ncbi:hypothetical protein CEUSTIGMA_g1018.t1 [Chlamydomonas eustigma]|uniref:Uncharacterized protein n=1 Tax=Chlamydomonas eustigma TaxID=1157962 RepID=A0A250WRT9_9CHLO|nr:hypothetical protein CEUSTIGMA_g1018.t1 [Chlamydomonas eustigma]|eukprot:GAX73567.1 hypothetical protein CEUSTIGMA_g1018.t1 [Chlamydomonas eustigma]
MKLEVSQLGMNVLETTEPMITGWEGYDDKQPDTDIPGPHKASEESQNPLASNARSAPGPSTTMWSPFHTQARGHTQSWGKEGHGTSPQLSPVLGNGSKLRTSNMPTATKHNLTLVKSAKSSSQVPRATDTIHEKNDFEHLVSQVAPVRTLSMNPNIHTWDHDNEDSQQLPHYRHPAHNVHNYEQIGRAFLTKRADSYVGASAPSSPANAVRHGHGHNTPPRSQFSNKDGMTAANGPMSPSHAGRDHNPFRHKPFQPDVHSGMQGWHAMSQPGSNPLPPLLLYDQEVAGGWEIIAGVMTPKTSTLPLRSATSNQLLLDLTHSPGHPATALRTQRTQIQPGTASPPLLTSPKLQLASRAKAPGTFSSSPLLAPSLLSPHHPSHKRRTPRKESHRPVTAAGVMHPLQWTVAKTPSAGSTAPSTTSMHNLTSKAARACACIPRQKPNSIPAALLDSPTRPSTSMSYTTPMLQYRLSQRLPPHVPVESIQADELPSGSLKGPGSWGSLEDSKVRSGQEQNKKGAVVVGGAVSDTIDAMMGTGQAVAALNASLARRQAAVRQAMAERNEVETGPAARRARAERHLVSKGRLSWRLLKSWGAANFSNGQCGEGGERQGGKPFDREAIAPISSFDISDLPPVPLPPGCPPHVEKVLRAKMGSYLIPSANSPVTPKVDCWA